MWYFTWILGLGMALAFGIINVLWLESSYAFGHLDEDVVRERFTSRSGREKGQRPNSGPTATPDGNRL